MGLLFYIGLFLFIACVIGVSLAGVVSIWEKHKNRKSGE
jgi:hypothetical protein